MVTDGNFTPTAVDVAEKTGISVRTVFRHFSNIEELYASIAGVLRERVFADMPGEIRPGNWENRIKQIITRRRVVFEALLNSLEFIIINRHQSGYISDFYKDILGESRLYLEMALQNYVDRTSDRFEALVILFSPAHLRLLRMEYRLSVWRAERILLTEALVLYPKPDIV